MDKTQEYKIGGAANTFVNKYRAELSAIKKAELESMLKEFAMSQVVDLEQQRDTGLSKGLSIARKWYKIGLVEAGAIDEGDFDKYFNEVHMPNILKEPNTPNKPSEKKDHLELRGLTKVGLPKSFLCIIDESCGQSKEEKKEELKNLSIYLKKDTKGEFLTQNHFSESIQPQEEQPSKIIIPDTDFQCVTCGYGFIDKEICPNCNKDQPKEQVEEKDLCDADEFQCCSDCDLPDACLDFGCAIKQGLVDDKNLL